MVENFADVEAPPRVGRFSDVGSNDGFVNGRVRAVEIDTTVNNLPGFQNQNIQTLTDNGLELLAELDAGAGFSVLGHFTTISSHADDDVPVGDGYFERYRRTDETVWAKYGQAEEQAARIYRFAERFEGER